LRLEVQPDVLLADSVFIAAQKPLQAILHVRLIPPSAGGVDTLLPLRWETRYRSFPPGKELLVDSVRTVPTRPGDIVLRMWYRPENPGADTIELRIFYRRYPTAPEERSDTVVVAGFGVMHQWRWYGEGASPGVHIFGDTVDFGRVRLANQATVRLRLRNAGTYRFHAADTLLPYTPEANRAFLATPSPFPPSGLEPADELELVLAFRPHTAGYAEAAYVLRSDLGQRVFGVPLEARQWYLFLRGIGVGPRLHLSPATLDIRFLWSATCPRSITHSITLRNVGSDFLQIDTLWLASGIAFTLTSLSLPILLEPGQHTQQPLNVAPPTAGEFFDTLFLRTNIPGTPVSILPLRVLSLSPSPVAMRFPDPLRAKPGGFVWVSIYVDTLPEGVGRCFLAMSYEPSLLQWEALRTEGTVLEGAEVVTIGEERPGVLVLHAQHPYGWLRRCSTLVHLGFRVFLGKRLSTPLTLQQIQLGDTLCPDFWNVTATSGLLTLDSVCGLSAKLLPEGTLRLEILPNPVSDELAVIYELPADGDVQIALFNTAGLHVQTLLQGRVEAGIHLQRWSLRGLPAGHYLCRLQFGDVHIVRILTLQQ
ncbi:MAG: T9SS type A sorting domain-containing protein, partial [Bacteroidota bacterium]|nr:T9SS type A sorting domain-containing protein [Bacteroidota bacterium]